MTHSPPRAGIAHASSIEMSAIMSIT